MSPWRRALIAVALPALGSVPLTPSAAAAPSVDPGALAHCASMTAADERLACYDSLARPKSHPAPAAPAASPASTKAKATPSTATAAPATPTAAAPAATAATAGSAAAAAAAAAPEAKSFGLTRHTPTAEEGPERIQAKVTRIDTDRLGNVRVSLDNGQAWTFNAPDALLRVGEAVTIRRGMVGSFLLTTANHHTYRAQRAE